LRLAREPSKKSFKRFFCYAKTLRSLAKTLCHQTNEKHFSEMGQPGRARWSWKPETAGSNPAFPTTEVNAWLTPPFFWIETQSANYLVFIKE
jgi:hypothetical protein